LTQELAAVSRVIRETLLEFSMDAKDPAKPRQEGLENSNVTRPSPPDADKSPLEQGNKVQPDRDGNKNEGEDNESKGLENLNVTRPSPPP
jgi:hypothetical protein